MTINLKHHPNFPSKLVDSRNIDVWLPPGYDDSGETRHPVIYMHDGQNLFEPEKSFIGVTWGIDEAMTKLIEAEEIPPAIVVGIWNNGEKRVNEYTPAKPFQSPVGQETLAMWAKSVEEEIGEKVDTSLVADDYLKFIATELKPFIDETYPTRPEQGDTHTMGSSLGALISLYAVQEYPEVFCGAGCVSMHWPIGDTLLVDYFSNHLPDPKLHKLYFDFGTLGVDEPYEPYQVQADTILSAAGWQAGVNWMTRKFEGHDHNETFWAKRVHVPLRFLLGK